MMQLLNPTLWRTCRTLAGRTRLSLLRALLTVPGQPVIRLAEEVGIGKSDASQELRRLQSRGILSVERKRNSVIYHPFPDPQVHSAAPLLKALILALQSPSKEQEEHIIQIATGLAHPRRIAIARVIKKKQQSILSLENEVGFHRNVLNRHLKLLIEAGFIHRKGKILLFLPSSHPLSLTLADLL